MHSTFSNNIIQILGRISFSLHQFNIFFKFNYSRWEWTSTVGRVHGRGIRHLFGKDATTRRRACLTAAVSSRNTTASYHDVTKASQQITSSDLTRQISYQRSSVCLSIRRSVCPSFSHSICFLPISVIGLHIDGTFKEYRNCM